MINWESIKAISEDKIIASSAVWIFITPLLVKLHDNLATNKNSESLFINENISLLYFSALAFFISSIMYKMLCPKVIKTTESYQDFVSRRMNHINIQEFMSESSKSTSIMIKSMINESTTKPTPQEIDENMTFYLEVNRDSCLNIKISEMDSIYWIIRNTQKKQTMLAIIICQSLNIIGAALLLLIMLSNARIVYNFSERFFV